MADLIDRQAAIDAINSFFGFNIEEEYGSAVQEVINSLPSAQPERKKGHWIEIQAPDSDGNGLYECSICHRGEVHVPIVEVPYCWHCGAQMTEGEG